MGVEEMVSFNGKLCAFPNEISGPDDSTFIHPGLTKREYFAACLMPALMNAEGFSIGYCAELIGIEVAEYRSHQHWRHVVAALAVQHADALLAAMTPDAEAKS